MVTGDRFPLFLATQSGIMNTTQWDDKFTFVSGWVTDLLHDQNHNLSHRV